MNELGKRNEVLDKRHETMSSRLYGKPDEKNGVPPRPGPSSRWGLILSAFILFVIVLVLIEFFNK